jgi:hypothetical protein
MLHQTLEYTWNVLLFTTTTQQLIHVPHVAHVVKTVMVDYQLIVLIVLFLPLWTQLMTHAKHARISTLVLCSSH